MNEDEVLDYLQSLTKDFSFDKKNKDQLLFDLFNYMNIKSLISINNMEFLNSNFCNSILFYSNFKSLIKILDDKNYTCFFNGEIKKTIELFVSESRKIMESNKKENEETWEILNEFIIYSNLKLDTAMDKDEALYNIFLSEAIDRNLSNKEIKNLDNIYHRLLSADVIVYIAYYLIENPSINTNEIKDVLKKYLNKIDIFYMNEVFLNDLENPLEKIRN